MVFSSLLDPVLGPLLAMNSLLAISLLSFFVALVTTLATKYFTNQVEMKRLKDDIKAHQKSMKNARDNPEEAMKINKEFMKTQLTYMKISMRASLITIIPLLFIFGWMSGHFAFESIKPNEEFTISMQFEMPVIGSATIGLPSGISSSGSLTKEVSSDNVMWSISGQEGSHFLDFTYGGKTYPKEVLITPTVDYIEPVKKIGEGDVKSISINYNKKIILNLFGWKMGWLITYILLSILFSLGLRKVMNVY